MISITESGMTFELAEDNCFQIELDPLVKKKHFDSTSNVKGCEFVTVVNGHHCFIEAKQSAPAGSNGNVRDLRLNGGPVPDNWTIFDNYRSFLRDISRKFIDSLHVLTSLSAGRHGKQRRDNITLPIRIPDPDKLRFILIVNLGQKQMQNFDKQQMASLNDALKNEMRPFLSIWNIPDTSIKVALPDDARRILKVPIV
ncbi:MAG: hypothetical protein K2M97_04965 [Muribaculaceae bacterium]|nr:hypothetical protein [Muribaculaceae bacterium]